MLRPILIDQRHTAVQESKAAGDAGGFDCAGQ
jgi:hypothetical protein